MSNQNPGDVIKTMDLIRSRQTPAVDRFFYPCLFRAPKKIGEAGGFFSDPEEASRESEVPDDGQALCCRACGRVITRSSERTEVDGAHLHTFANPHGIVYQIGCFRAARGCSLVGSATDDFTWFKGYRWRVAVCGSCLAHLGWLYARSSAGQFFGLILDHLVERP